ncbi:hypothetical protein JTB14_004308 [Gonioctena quinquepunctata]|nr:hypothetical protein JTB14_004308 [Gonioctena quinquepunctata]
MHRELFQLCTSQTRHLWTCADIVFSFCYLLTPRLWRPRVISPFSYISTSQTQATVKCKVPRAEKLKGKGLHPHRKRQATRPPKPKGQMRWATWGSMAKMQKQDQDYIEAKKSGTGSKGSGNPKRGTGPRSNHRPSQEPKEGKRRKASRHLHKKVGIRPRHATRRSSGKEEDEA